MEPVKLMGSLGKYMLMYTKYMLQDYINPSYHHIVLQTQGQDCHNLVQLLILAVHNNWRRVIEQVWHIRL
jgi:hypothetical protein